MLLLILKFRVNTLDARDAIHSSSQGTGLTRLGFTTAPSEERAEREAPLFRCFSYRRQAD